MPQAWVRWRTGKLTVAVYELTNVFGRLQSVLRVILSTSGAHHLCDEPLSQMGEARALIKRLMASANNVRLRNPFDYEAMTISSRPSLPPFPTTVF
jgi:hypothetical protein